MDGWCLPLAEVPDPVFAQAMAGDGVAIDPTSGVLCAPCAGEILPMKDARHAVTLRTSIGIDVLVHVGIDTVKLGGDGFDLRVRAGERVREGQELLRFDLDLVARRAPSLVTPVILPSGGVVMKRSTGRLVRAGEPIAEIAAAAGAPASEAAGIELRRALTVAFDHGLHVRPAAQVAGVLGPFAAEVTFAFQGRTANARSPVAMMSLGAHRGDTVDARARGPDAAAALAALAALLPEKRCQAPFPPTATAGKVPGTVLTPQAVPGTVLPKRLEASVASRGVAVGRVVHWARPELAVAERGSGAAGEGAALDRALEGVRRHLQAASAGSHGERRALLDAHAHLVADPELRARAGEALAQGKSASFAWRQAMRAVAAQLAALDDPRMRERAADLRDLEDQVLRILAGEAPEASRRFDRDSILVADDLPPSALLGLDGAAIAGLCTARGGPTSHVAILAAAAGIPALVAAGPRLLDIAEGTRVVLDADHGWVDVDPAPAEIAAIERAIAERERERAAEEAAARDEAHTRDGVRIRVNANLGSLGEVAHALARGAEGCGLLRTEFLFLDRREAPGEDEQAGEYQRIATALEGRTLAIRTLDAGGDKPIAYLPTPREENPALGLRGVRTSLWRPDLLREQLRAILRVRPHGQCRVLLPMVTDAEEVHAVRRLIEDNARELAVPAAKLGVMIETPASALLAHGLARVVDFFSIGSNDLAQYALAIDRGHPELARRLDALHPAVLRLIALVADAGRDQGKPVSLCGALGSDADALPVLVGLGVHEVSAAPSAVPRLKRTARLLHASECREAARRAVELATAGEVRELAAAVLARSRESFEALTGGPT